MNERWMDTLMKEKSSAATAEKLKKALARKQRLQSLRDYAHEGGSGLYQPPLWHKVQITTLRKKRRSRCGAGGVIPGTVADAGRDVIAGRTACGSNSAKTASTGATPTRRWSW